jgi:hypothetical protein
MNGYYKLVAEVLRQHGYKIIRQSGTSHQVWSNGQRNPTATAWPDNVGLHLLANPTYSLRMYRQKRNLPASLSTGSPIPTTTPKLRRLFLF